MHLKGVATSVHGLHACNYTGNNWMKKRGVLKLYKFIFLLILSKKKNPCKLIMKSNTVNSYFN